MLVANPGRTPYSFSTNKPKTTTINTNPSTSKDASLILNNHQKPSTSSGVLIIPSTSSALTSSSSSSLLGVEKVSSLDLLRKTTKYDVLNTLSVRINRGTELLKQKSSNWLSKIQPLKGGLLTVPPTSIHRSPNRNTKSTDSLNVEMCHFKPIRTVPTTPYKKTKIITAPKARRIQRPNLIRFDPIKRIIPLIKSNYSAFYSVKRSVDFEFEKSPKTNLETSSKSKIIPNRKTRSKLKENNVETNEITSTIVTRKRNYNKSLSIPLENNSKNNNLKNTSISNTSQNSKTNANPKQNGLIEENGLRRSIRIFNRKRCRESSPSNINMKNLKINVNEPTKKNAIKKRRKNIELKNKETEESKKSIQSGRISKIKNNITKISKTKMNNKKNHSKIVQQKPTGKTLRQQKNGVSAKNINISTVNCTTNNNHHNLRPRIGK